MISDKYYDHTAYFVSMVVHAYKFQHEELQFQRMSDIIRETAEREKTKMYLFGNPIVESAFLDALLVTSKGFYILEFKKHEGKVDIQMQHWIHINPQGEKSYIMGGSKDNPLEQAMTNRAKCFAALEQIGHKNLLPLKVFVVFNGDVEIIGNVLSENVRNWLKVCDVRHFAGTLTETMSDARKVDITQLLADLNSYMGEMSNVMPKNDPLKMAEMSLANGQYNDTLTHLTRCTKTDPQVQIMKMQCYWNLGKKCGQAYQENFRDLLYGSQAQTLNTNLSMFGKYYLGLCLMTGKFGFDVDHRKALEHFKGLEKWELNTGGLRKTINETIEMLEKEFRDIYVRDKLRESENNRSEMFNRYDNSLLRTETINNVLCISIFVLFLIGMLAKSFVGMQLIVIVMLAIYLWKYVSSDEVFLESRFPELDVNWYCLPDVQYEDIDLFAETLITVKGLVSVVLVSLLFGCTGYLVSVVTGFSFMQTFQIWLSGYIQMDLFKTLLIFYGYFAVLQTCLFAFCLYKNSLKGEISARLYRKDHDYESSYTALPVINLENIQVYLRQAVTTLKVSVMATVALVVLYLAIPFVYGLIRSFI